MFRVRIARYKYRVSGFRGRQIGQKKHFVPYPVLIHIIHLNHQVMAIGFFLLRYPLFTLSSSNVGSLLEGRLDQQGEPAFRNILYRQLATIDHTGQSLHCDVQGICNCNLYTLVGNMILPSVYQPRHCCACKEQTIKESRKIPITLFFNILKFFIINLCYKEN
jgi:hypothetical protein